MTPREEIIQTIHKLFIYTDARAWDKLQNEVFTPSVFLDMTSVGGEARVKLASQICNDWDAGFEGIDAINHLAGNFLVDIQDSIALVYAYATATHFKSSAKNGKVREFVGSYDFKLEKTDKGWHINSMTYHLKYKYGNLELD